MKFPSFFSSYFPLFWIRSNFAVLYQGLFKEKFRTAHIGILRRQRVFDWGGGGGRRIFYLHIGDRIMVWLGGRIGERPDKLDFGCES